MIFHHWPINSIIEEVFTSLFNTESIIRLLLDIKLKRLQNYFMVYHNFNIKNCLSGTGIWEYGNSDLGGLVSYPTLILCTASPPLLQNQHSHFWHWTVPDYVGWWLSAVHLWWALSASLLKYCWQTIWCTILIWAACRYPRHLRTGDTMPATAPYPLLYHTNNHRCFQETANESSPHLSIFSWVHGMVSPPKQTNLG